MNVELGRETVRQWVHENAAVLPGFRGAWFAGSITTLPGSATLPATSDIDVMVVFETRDTLGKPGKFMYQGVLLEITYMSIGELQSAEHILGHYHLAGGFRTSSIIADPTGRLTGLQSAVGKEYAQRPWVERRCNHALNTVISRLDDLNQRASAPLHDQVMPWLFATAGVPHVLLVAGLRNPTVRRRYETVRNLLQEYGQAAFYPGLLEQLGCADISRERAAHHLEVLGSVFDEAAAMITTPFFFAADITHAARPVAIDGSREMIERGDHREAIFWIVATSSRCMTVLHADAPAALAAKWEPGYRDLLADLGIHSFAGMQQRGEKLRATLPHVRDLADAIMNANPEIVAG